MKSLGQYVAELVLAIFMTPSNLRRSGCDLVVSIKKLAYESCLSASQITMPDYHPSLYIQDFDL